MNTILIKPNGKLEQYQSTSKLSACEFPLWMAILANYYKANYLLDAEAENLNHENIVKKLKEYDVDNAIIFCTGNHPSANIQQEEAGKLLCTTLNQNNINANYITKLPISPIKWGKPRYDLLDINKYIAHNWLSWSNNCNTIPYSSVYTSISCLYTCEFCQVKSFYGSTYEARLIEEVIDDFKDLGNMDIKNIKIMDELFIFNKNRTSLICEKIKELEFNFNIWAYARIDIMDSTILKLLKRAGINWLSYGIESGDYNIRKNVSKGTFDNKRIKEVVQMTKNEGINVLGNFMFGFRDDNIDTLQKTKDFIFELNCEYVNLYCVVCYPDSKLFEELKNENIDLPTKSIEYAQMSEYFKPLPTKYLTANEVLRFRDNTFNEYFTNNNYLEMMYNKFGFKVIENIQEMTQIKIKRKLLEQ